jgi:hypothetical protein
MITKDRREVLSRCDALCNANQFHQEGCSYRKLQGAIVKHYRDALQLEGTQILENRQSSKKFTLDVAQ